MTQLQARYPAASLIAEFVTLHQENFVVRALVQVGGTTLATGMAAAADIEQAEDRAKLRALNALGVGSFAASLPTPTPSYPLSSTPIATTDFVAPDHSRPTAEAPEAIVTNLPPLPSIAPLSQEPTTPLPAANSPLSFTTPASFTPLPQPEPEVDRPEYELSYEPEPDDEPEIAPLPDIELPPVPSSFSLDAPDPELPPLSDPEIEPAKPAAPTGKGKSTRRKSENTEIAPPSTGENDRSEEIAKIGLEMKRLGWTTEQGRNYLKRTYGKRSRQELDDSELIDFLRYLEAQVSPSESPF